MINNKVLNSAADLDHDTDLEVYKGILLPVGAIVRIFFLITEDIVNEFL